MKQKLIKKLKAMRAKLYRERKEASSLYATCADWDYDIELINDLLKWAREQDDDN